MKQNYVKQQRILPLDDNEMKFEVSLFSYDMYNFLLKSQWELDKLRSRQDNKLK